MPHITLCSGRMGDDERTPLLVCADCRRRTTPPGERQSHMEPPVRRVAARHVWRCEMRLPPQPAMASQG